MWPFKSKSVSVVPERVPPYWLPQEKPAYAFCESVTGIGPWHIRKLSAAGLKLRGGIDTPTLCGFVRPTEDTSSVRRGWGGWDLNTRITASQLEGEHCCADCRAHYEKEMPP
jgi:hypothetical protein